MVVKELKPVDFEDVRALFSEWGIPTGVANFASDEGFICNHGGKNIGCIFLYTTNSPMVMLDLLCVSKKLSRKERGNCIDFLVYSAMKKAKDMGFSAVLAQPRAKKSGSRLIGYGFKKVSKESYWMELEKWAA